MTMYDLVRFKKNKKDLTKLNPSKLAKEQTLS